MIGMRLNEEYQYCCEMKEYCDKSPQLCPIAKRTKDIALFDAEKKELRDAILASMAASKRKLCACLNRIKRRNDGGNHEKKID